MKHSVVGMDIAKRVFQQHCVAADTGEIERIKLRRDEVLPFFAQRTSSLVAMEACGSSHWWARQLRALGHEVRLLAPKSVRPFVRSNKTDAAGARAIRTAVQQPEARLVGVKERAATGDSRAAPGAGAVDVTLRCNASIPGLTVYSVAMTELHPAHSRSAAAVYCSVASTLCRSSTMSG